MEPRSLPASDPSRSPSFQDARHTVIGSTQNFLASFLAVPTGILTAAFLTRRLGPAAYGQLSVTMAVILWIEAALSSGMVRAAVKFVAEERDWRETGAWFVRVQWILSGGVAVLIVVLSPLLARAFHDASLAGFIRILSLKLPFGALTNLYGAFLIGLGCYGRRALLNGGYWLARLAYVVLWVSLFPSVDTALAATVLASVTMWLWGRRFVGRLEGAASSRPSRTPLVGFTGVLFFYNIVVQLLVVLDLCFVKALAPLPEAAGFYGAARNLAIVPGLVGSAVSPLILGKITSLKAEGEEEEARVLARESLRMVLWMLPFAVLTWGISDPVAVAVYGSRFQPAGKVLGIIIFMGVGATAAAFCFSVLAALGNTRRALIFAVLILVLEAAALPWGIRRYGISGAAGIATGLMWLLALGLYGQADGIWKIRMPGRVLMRIGIICAATGIALRCWPVRWSDPWLKAAGAVALVLAGFVGTGEWGTKERRMVRRIFFSHPSEEER